MSSITMPESVLSSITAKVAIITGASCGIGRGIALDFARQGCSLTLTGRDEAKLELTKSQCIEQGLAADSILLVQADMMNNDDIKRIVDMTAEKFNQIDILINNAGIVVFGTLADLPMEKYHEIMQVNLHSVVYLTKLCLPYLEKTKGNIVHMSSVGSQIPAESLFSYNMVKGALDQFCRSLALDLGPKGIRVNAVNPSMTIGTEIVSRTGLFDEAQLKVIYEYMESLHPLQRYAEVSEVARVISFLVSDKAEQTTGALFFIDGGRTQLYLNNPSETADQSGSAVTFCRA